MISILLALACGSERQPVKTLADAPELATKTATVTTVAALRSLPPIAWHNAAPRTAAERQVIGVAAFVVGFKLESDRDWHVVIRDSAGRTMIAEFVDPGCTSTPALAAAFAKARKQFLAVVGITPTPTYRTLPKPIPVAIAGVVFLDHAHGQTGGAPNGVELHAALWMSRRKVA